MHCSWKQRCSEVNIGLGFFSILPAKSQHGQQMLLLQQMRTASINSLTYWKRMQSTVFSVRFVCTFLFVLNLMQMYSVCKLRKLANCQLLLKEPFGQLIAQSAACLPVWMQLPLHCHSAFIPFIVICHTTTNSTTEENWIIQLERAQPHKLGYAEFHWMSVAKLIRHKSD